MGSCGCDPGQRSVVDVVTKYNDGVPKGVAVQQTVTWTPNQVPRLIGHHATDPLWWRARSAAETVAGQIFSVDARIAAVISQGIRRNRIRRVTGKLLRYYVVAQYISPTRRVGHAGQASESRRQLVLAVALDARSAWSMASGGGCVAGRARVDHGCVRARVVGKRKPHMPQPGAMADASNVRHDTIVVPETMSPAQVRALAERKAQAQVGDDDMVAFFASPRITAGRR